MKEVEILSAILLILIGAMVVESGYGLISIILGFVLLGAGVFLYLFTVDTLEESSSRSNKKRDEHHPLDCL
jgi:multisubunit Na+/H+ antiporter MnhC subunit